MNDVLLNVENLSVAFKYERRYIPVTHDVSFQVRSGEILGLVGESGSGKSVTAKVIMGLLPRDSSKIVSGRVVLEGRDVTKLTPKEFCGLRGKQAAMIFQEPMTSLNPLYLRQSAGGSHSSAPVPEPRAGMGGRHRNAAAGRYS